MNQIFNYCCFGALFLKKGNKKFFDTKNNHIADGVIGYDGYIKLIIKGEVEFADTAKIAKNSMVLNIRDDERNVVAVCREESTSVVTIFDDKMQKIGYVMKKDNTIDFYDEYDKKIGYAI